MKKLEMKKCKECGELFVPSHPNQVYCNKMHYRPCPVCGKPVFAKYLSDPARCCSGKCRYISGQRNKKSNNIDVPEHVVDNSKVKEYINETVFNSKTQRYAFVKGHKYEVDIITEGKGKHIVKSIWDVTDNKEHEESFPFSNKKHISKYFKAI